MAGEGDGRLNREDRSLALFILSFILFDSLNGWLTCSIDCATNPPSLRRLSSSPPRCTHSHPIIQTMAPYPSNECMLTVKEREQKNKMEQKKKKKKSRHLCLLCFHLFIHLVLCLSPLSANSPPCPKAWCTSEPANLQSDQPTSQSASPTVVFSYKFFFYFQGNLTGYPSGT